MTKRTYTTKSGDTFEWDETPEVIEAVKKLHELEKKQRRHVQRHDEEGSRQKDKESASQVTREPLTTSTFPRRSNQ